MTESHVHSLHKTKEMLHQGDLEPLALLYYITFVPSQVMTQAVQPEAGNWGIWVSNLTLYRHQQAYNLKSLGPTFSINQLTQDCGGHLQEL